MVSEGGAKVVPTFDVQARIAREEAEASAAAKKADADDVANQQQMKERAAYTAGRAANKVREQKEETRLKAIRDALPLEERKFFDGVQILLKRGEEWGSPSQEAVEETLRRAGGHAGKAAKILQDRFDHEMNVRKHLNMDVGERREKAKKKAELRSLGRLMNSTLEGEDEASGGGANTDGGNLDEEEVEIRFPPNPRAQGGSWKNKVLFVFGLAAIFVVLDIAATLEFGAGMMFNGIL